ncbi:MAG TPA: hypothetical protein VK304_14780, partial [Thermoleophilaceae bacterium]|nr:hypothetical protein [Thermoleophilaceae bacterium]
TPSPTRADSPGPEQKRGETRRAGRFDRVSSDERPAEGAEASPAEKAATGQGRGPAPMGGGS